MYNIAKIRIAGWGKLVEDFSQRIGKEEIAKQDDEE